MVNIFLIFVIKNKRTRDSDFQVKIRGQRIELGEIEEKITRFPQIDSCVVVKKEDESSHEFLCAYYQAEENVNIKEIYRFLEKLLPKYMIPQYFVKVKKWPYNHNGKIDIKQLPEIQFNVSRQNIVKPRNEVDKKLIEIIKNILNVNTISMYDSFFELGGDSLAAINLCVVIQNEFKIKIQIRDILENPIIENLSDIISKSTKDVEVKAISKTKNNEYYPVSSAQKRIYFASKVAENNSTLYNTPGGIIFEGDIDIYKLQNHLNTLINRHESLRTYFEVVNENVVQKILANTTFKLDIVKNQKYEEIDKIFKEFVKPFDLSKAPLFRAEYVTFTNGKSVLFIDIHHIVFDGKSSTILLEELCKLYNGETLPELTITYKDYAEFENSIQGQLSRSDSNNLSEAKVK